MTFNAASAQALLKQFAFPKLFLEELGWDRHNAALSVEITGTSFARKRPVSPAYDGACV